MERFARQCSLLPRPREIGGIANENLRTQLRCILALPAVHILVEESIWCRLGYRHVLAPNNSLFALDTRKMRNRQESINVKARNKFVDAF